MMLVSMSQGEGVVSKQSPFPVAETLDRLEKLLQSKSIQVFARVDHSGEAQRAGLQMNPTQLLIFGNPKGGTPVMVAEPTAAIDLPLKALAWQDDAGTVWLSWNDPEYIRRRFGLSEEVMRPLAGIGTLLESAI
jgi:uncharacterized protein (DUF302 family)